MPSLRQFSKGQVLRSISNSFISLSVLEYRCEWESSSRTLILGNSSVSTWRLGKIYCPAVRLGRWRRFRMGQGREGWAFNPWLDICAQREVGGLMPQMRLLCTLVADLSKLRGLLKKQKAPNGSAYWAVNFTVAILFGGTQLHARLKWMEGVRAISNLLVKNVAEWILLIF